MSALQPRSLNQETDAVDGKLEKTTPPLRVVHIIAGLGQGGAETV